MTTTPDTNHYSRAEAELDMAIELRERADDFGAIYDKISLVDDAITKAQSNNPELANALMLLVDAVRLLVNMVSGYDEPDDDEGEDLDPHEVFYDVATPNPYTYQPNPDDLYKPPDDGPEE